MPKSYGYKYFSEKRKSIILKRISFISSILLIIQISLGSLLYVAPAAESQADNGNLCEQPADIVLIMDRSGSMDYTSRCDWWQLKCVNPPSCSSGYNWVQNTDYNQSQSWCTAKNQSAPHQAVYLAIDPKKIVAAKNAANNFLGLMGVNDKSSLISYANTATLDKGLSSDHPATKAAVDSLVTIGATNIGDAIKLGAQELKSSRANPQATHAMILLTDGLANKPNGPGYGEYAADVAYAENQAVLAAGYGFKIFTIGLGTDGEINETMLQNIASTTGATYHHSPTQNDLQSIYDSISSQVCQYGSISGCKYSDVNQDGQITGEEKLSGWEIKLNNSENFSQLTDANGCYQFSGLTSGTYTVSEGGKTGVVSEQTYPAGGSYSINLADSENITNKDFGNYLPICGNGMIDAGYTGYSETCEIGQSQVCSEADYSGSQSCQADCSGWNQCVSNEACGDGVINNGEQCDGAAGVSEHYTCTTSCTLEYIPYCGDSLVNQSSEQCDNSAPETCTMQTGYSGARECAAGCVWANCSSTESCGDGAINGSEICDDGASNGQPNYCASNCTGPTPAFCGNGVKEGSEQCDGTDGVGANQSCTASCTLNSLPYCGDGSVNQTSEQCDGGSQSCTTANNYSGLRSCDSGCQWGGCAATESCGDGFKNGNEQCDGTDGVGAHQSCSNTCALVNEPYCGDGIKNGTEQCDGTDGVGANQSCSASCTLINLPYCGDGAINGSETCDDGTNNGKYGYCDTSCAGPTQAVCGNGTKEGAEQCDDGNTSSGDGCGATCQSEGGGGGGGGDKGSLKVCKYEDADGNILTATNQPGVSDWSFNVGDGVATSSQLTLADGCTVFSALTPGQYQINEESRTGWYYLEPVSGSATTTVTANQQAEVKFYNVRYGKIIGYEYADADGLTSTTGDRGGLDNWTINLFNPLSSTTALLSTTTGADGYFEFTDLTPDTYSLKQDLKATWVNLINPADITLTSGQTKENNNFINTQSGGQGGGDPVCGDGIKDGTEQCDGSAGVTSGYTCNSQCVLVANQTGGGGGGGGGSIPPCILTNTCGSSNSASTAVGSASSTEITITAPSATAAPTGEVLGQKITAKPAGKVLAQTGFKFSEFITLLAILLLLLNLIFIIKTKYLKTTVKKLNWLKKTLIFNQDLLIYERADNYFKNR